MYISIGTNGCINRFNGYIDLDDRRISYSIDLPQTPSPEFIQNTDLTIGNKRLEGLLKVTFIEFLALLYLNCLVLWLLLKMRKNFLWQLVLVLVSLGIIVLMII